MFLTREQLKGMTNGKRPKEIIAWLERHAPRRFRVGLDGWPVVHEEVARELFGVEAKPRARRHEPNFDHLKGIDGKATQAST